jgi:hypothetical protein
MPDSLTPTQRDDFEQALRSVVPPALMTLGVLSLLRTSRYLSLAVVGMWLYTVAKDSDTGRRQRGRYRSAKQAGEARMDEALADSFPSSDPPSSSGMTAGAP